jgi:hypothetical protein
VVQGSLPVVNAKVSAVLLNARLFGFFLAHAVEDTGGTGSCYHRAGAAGILDSDLSVPDLAGMVHKFD